MKALFLTFHTLVAHSGISKKIQGQVAALRRCGVTTALCSTHMDAQGYRFRLVDQRPIASLGTGFMSKVKSTICCQHLTRHILENAYDFLYVRSERNANPFLVQMFHRVHQQGTRIVVEIPTFPYDGEVQGAPLRTKAQLWMDILCRKYLYRHVHSIVSFTSAPQIFGVPNIAISNAVDFAHIPVKMGGKDAGHKPDPTFHIIAVAEIQFWHGFDRIIKGLAAYAGSKSIALHIVGEGPVREDLHQLVQGLGLQDRVIFHGRLAGEALDQLFTMAHFAVASLGRHRCGISTIKTLKNREYAARGIPFIYSETDDDFEHMPYVLKAPADESPIDVQELINFYDALPLTPQQIRASIEGALSWDVQMQKVVQALTH